MNLNCSRTHSNARAGLVLLLVGVFCILSVGSLAAQMASGKNTRICLPGIVVPGAPLCLNQHIDSVKKDLIFQEPLTFADPIKAYGGKLKSSPFLNINIKVDSTTGRITGFVAMRDARLLDDLMGKAWFDVINDCRKTFGDDYRIVENTRKTPEQPIEPIIFWSNDAYAAAMYVSAIEDPEHPEHPKRLVPFWLSLELQPAKNNFKDRPDSKIWTRAALGLPEKETPKGQTPNK